MWILNIYKNLKNGIQKVLKSLCLHSGIISTILDILCFAVLWFVMKFNSIEKANLFQTGWFAFGIISQTLIIHTIRTNKIPFVTSKSSKQLLLSTSIITIITLIISFTNIATIFDLSKLPFAYIVAIIDLMIIYVIAIKIYKKTYLKKNEEWL